MKSVNPDCTFFCSKLEMSKVDLEVNEKKD